MFKQESSASRAQRISRIEALRSYAGAPAFGPDLQFASCNRTGEIEGATTCHEAADTLITGHRESVGNVQCAS